MSVGNIPPDLWFQVKPLLIPYDGMASQLYVLDLPLASAEGCLNKFFNAVINPHLSSTSDPKSGFQDAQLTPTEQKNIVLSSLRDEIIHIVHGEIFGKRQVNFYLWVDQQRKTFDAELVFWADQFFPKPNDDVACQEAFGEILEIAEKMRLGHNGCECVLSVFEVGNPRNDRQENWTVFW